VRRPPTSVTKVGTEPLPKPPEVPPQKLPEPVATSEPLPKLSELGAAPETQPQKLSESVSASEVLTETPVLYFIACVAFGVLVGLSLAYF